MVWPTILTGILETLEQILMKPRSTNVPHSSLIQVLCTPYTTQSQLRETTEDIKVLIAWFAAKNTNSDAEFWESNIISWFIMYFQMLLPKLLHQLTHPNIVQARHYDILQRLNCFILFTKHILWHWQMHCDQNQAFDTEKTHAPDFIIYKKLMYTINCVTNTSES